jgi:CHAT domain-containing protein
VVSLVVRLLLAAVTAGTEARAADPFAECEARFARQPDAYESSYCFFQAAQQGKRWDEAGRRLDALMRRHPANHWLTLARGNVEWTRDLGRAEQLYRRSAEGFAAQGQAEGEVLARYNLRTVLFRAGRVEEAGREVERAMRVAEASGQGVLIARAYTMRATQLTDTGRDLDEAYRSLRQAEQSAGRDAPYTLRRGILFALGNTCFQLGRFEEALGHYRRVDEMAGPAKDALSRAIARYSEVNTLMRALEELPRPGGREEIVALARSALEAARTADNRESQVLLHRTLGELLSVRGAGGAAAEAHFDRCIVQARRLQQPRELAQCLWSLARHLAGQGRAAEARLRLDEAMALARGIDEGWSLAHGARHVMRVSWRTRPRGEAIEESLQALRAIETVHRLPGKDVGAEVLSGWARDYYWLAGRLLEHDGPSPARADVSRAFEVVERMRARVLLERLTADHRRRADDLRFARLDEVERVLGEDEAVLSFMIGLQEELDGDFGGGGWLTVSTRGGTSVYRVPDRARLQAVVPVFLGLFDPRDGREAAAAAALFGELLAPALAALPNGVRRLVIVPDDALHHLPFAALRPSPDQDPLVARYEIALAPSATLWLRWRQHARQPPARSALVLADPAIGGGDREPARAPAAFRGSTPALARTLGPLPHAREEGRAIVRKLGRRAELWVGPAASERALKAAPLKDFAVLHFAAHALLDDERYERSAVLLAAGSDTEDGLLQSGEVDDLALQGQAVVLSACRSASGSTLRGEGVMGLGRAFFTAGADAVVGSLWPLRDDEAAVLFDAFYRALRDGSSLSAALRAAQRKAIRQGLPAAAWAGLVVAGDGSLAPLPASPSRGTRHAVAALAGLAVLAIAWRLLRTWRVRPRT